MLVKRLIIFLFVASSAFLKAQFNYGHQMTFGKNRIQYKEFVWSYMDFERFRIYSYQGGTEIAKYVSFSFEKQMAMLEKRLDYQYDEKINILVYNNQNDFKQSNIGLSSEEQTNVGGFTRIIGDKICIYFNGSHAELDQQIRQAIAELLISNALYGGNIREVIRNSTLLYVPEWFTKGLAKYLAEGWHAKSDDQVYDAFKSDYFGKFSSLTDKQAENVGHAIWYYIVSTYGESMIANTLYMTRLTRSIDHAFLTTLGVTIDNLIYDYSESFQRRAFMQKDTSRKAPNLKNSVLKRFSSLQTYYNAKINADGSQVIYATNKQNQLRVFLRTFNEDGTTNIKQLLKFGTKLEQIEDLNYPLLAWHPSGKMVLMVYPVKDELMMHFVNLETNEHVKKPMVGFEKVNSIAYNNDGKKLAMSAVKKGKGQSDIFVYGANTGGIEQLTNDSWDDANPVFMRSSKQIVFESNRINDTIKANEDALYTEKMNRNMDLFVAQYPFTNKALVRITNTPNLNETKPQVYKNTYVAYLSDRNGVNNRYLAEFDSAISFVDTTEHYRYFFKSKVVGNSERSILDQEISTNNLYAVERIMYKGKDRLLRNKLNDLEKVERSELPNTWFRTNITSAVNNPSDYKDLKSVETPTIQRSSGNSGQEIDINNYRFEGEKQNANASTQTPKTETFSRPKKTSSGYKFPQLKNYNTSFYTDYIVSQFDNAYMANGYQKFTNSEQPVYLNPGFNLLNKVAISDLFEDQRILGGFRINPFSDNEFLASWEQRKNLADHQILYDRQAINNMQGVTASGLLFNYKQITHSVTYSIKYPFSPVSAVKGSVLYRGDRQIIFSQSDFTLQQKNGFDNMAGLRAEYIYDNTRKVMINIYNGFRFKAWTEYWQYANSTGNNLFTSGFDARHYLKLHKQITWCNRLAGGNSTGTQKLLYYLGGIDNSLFPPRFNNAINIINPQEYGFQTLATNMRGFSQNIRNGNNFVVFNSELRIPIVKYILNNPVRSEALNSLQIVGFGDLGAAWHGINPLSSENTENYKTFVQQGTNVVVTVINNKNPLVGGAGFGFRSKLLGYFMRLDFAWGIDNWTVQNRAVTLSLATDF